MDWEDEQKCFDGIATEYGHFCAIEYDPFLDDAHSTDAPPTNEEGETPPVVSGCVCSCGHMTSSCNLDGSQADKTVAMAMDH